MPANSTAPLRLTPPTPPPGSSPGGGRGIGVLAVLVVLAVLGGIVAVVVNAQGSKASPPLVEPQPSAVADAPAAAPVGSPGPGGEATWLSNSWGVDVSWPQCDGIPPLPAGFAVVGVNGGRPFTDNPCLAAQVAYAKRTSGYAAYLNLAAPRGVDPTSYGRQSALDGLARARRAGLHVHTVWLDVEVLNHWADPATNVAVINGAASALQSRGVTAGVYSSVPMWQQITGGGRLSMPLWLATSVTDYRDVQPLCVAGLGGQRAVMAQYVAAASGKLIDVDVLCNNALPDAVGMFTAGKHR